MSTAMPGPLVPPILTFGRVRTEARYDSYARWYDERLTPFAQRATALIRDWLGPGPGRCLELACGGGLHLPTVVEAGWLAVGPISSQSQESGGRSAVSFRLTPPRRRLPPARSTPSTRR